MNKYNEIPISPFASAKLQDASQVDSPVTKQPRYLNLAHEITSMIKHDFSVDEQNSFIKELINNLKDYHFVKKEEANALYKKACDDYDTICSL